MEAKDKPQTCTPGVCFLVRSEQNKIREKMDEIINRISAVEELLHKLELFYTESRTDSK